MGTPAAPRAPRASPACSITCGFLYHSDADNDDLPYYVEEGGRPHLVVPYTLTNDDVNYGTSNFGTGEDFFTCCRAAFDFLYAEGDEPAGDDVDWHARRPGTQCAGPPDRLVVWSHQQRRGERAMHQGKIDELMREGGQGLARRLGAGLALPDAPSPRRPPARAARWVALGAALAALGALGRRRRASPR